jgi:hypothetical protein
MPPAPPNMPLNRRPTGQRQAPGRRPRLTARQSTPAAERPPPAPGQAPAVRSAWQWCAGAALPTARSTPRGRGEAAGAPFELKPPPTQAEVPGQRASWPASIAIIARNPNGMWTSR